MTHEISDAQAASFRSQGPAVIKAYLESKAWQQSHAGPRNIWYRREVAWDLCPYCDDPDGPIREDPYCPLHDDATWALLWPCAGGAAAHDALRTLCYAEERGPEEILRALSLRDRDEVRVRCSSSLWPEIRTVDSAVNFFLSLDQVLASAAGRDTTADSENSYVLGEHPYTVELVSENEVLFSFPLDELPTRDGSPSASRRAAQRLYSAACGQMRSSDRSTHVATRYATGEWTTVEVLGPEDLPLPTSLEAHVGSLIHQFGLTTWTLDQALPSQRPTPSS